MFGDTPMIFSPGGTATPNGVYPISAYGFSTASDNISVFKTTSALANTFYARIFVPKGNAITTAGTIIPTAGTVGAGGLNGFAVYSDAGVLLGSTTTDDALWGTVGWRTKALSAPVAASSVDRFVIAGITVNGFTVSPNSVYAEVGPSSGAGMSGGNGVTNRRSFFSGSLAAWPATINPATEGTATSFLPLIALG